MIPLLFLLFFGIRAFQKQHVNGTTALWSPLFPMSCMAPQHLCWTVGAAPLRLCWTQRRAQLICCLKALLPAHSVFVLILYSHLFSCWISLLYFCCAYVTLIHHSFTWVPFKNCSNPSVLAGIHPQKCLLNDDTTLLCHASCLKHWRCKPRVQWKISGMSFPSCFDEKYLKTFYCQAWQFYVNLY